MAKVMSLDPRTEIHPPHALPPGFRCVRHDLLGEKNAGALYVSAGPRSDKTDSKTAHCILLIAGFPCDQSSFFELAARLAAHEDTVVGITCMPEYDRVGPGRQSPLRPDGYDFEEIQLCFQQAVGALYSQICPRADADTDNAKEAAPGVTIIAHDWGTVPALQYSSGGPSLPGLPSCEKLVLFDVIPDYKPQSVYCALVHATYMLWFAAAFSVSRFSDKLGRFVMTCSMLILFVLFGRWMNPCSPHFDNGKGGIKSHEVEPYHCYPYYHMVRTAVSGAVGARSGGSVKSTRVASLRKSLQQQPVLYMYGTSKNTFWHDAHCLKSIREQGNGSRVVAVGEAGHWLYKSQPEICAREVEKFVFEQ